jgi:hypothetical protein
VDNRVVASDAARSLVDVISAEHEAIVAAAYERPAFPADLLRLRGFPLAEFDRAEMMPADLTTYTPTEFRADAVIRYFRGEAVEFAIVYEVQISPDPGKRRTWPAYVANVYERAGCPVILVVVAPKRAVARRCAVPIVVGEPDFVLTPMVFGPDGVSVVTDPEEARRYPQLAVLSALAHGGGAQSTAVLDALSVALDNADLQHRDLYAGAVMQALPEAARIYLEETMATRERRFHLNYLQESYEKGEAVGEAKGEAKAILEVLDSRGVEVPDDVREQITSCTDAEQLLVWIRRVAFVKTVEDLFDLPDAA